MKIGGKWHTKEGGGGTYFGQFLEKFQLRASAPISF